MGWQVSAKSAAKIAEVQADHDFGKIYFDIVTKVCSLVIKIILGTSF